MAVAFRVELQSMQALLTQQAASIPSQQFSALATLQADAFASRAEQLDDLTVEMVGELTSIVQNGPWPSAEQSKLVVALANALAGTPTLGGGRKKDKRATQHLAHFRAWTNTNEKERLQDSSIAFTEKVSVAFDVCDRIQAVLLSEVSKRNVLASVAAAHARPQGWSVHELREWYTTFKRDYHARFKDKRAHPSIGHMKRYPEDPSMIPENKREILFHGCPVAPLELDLELLAEIEGNIWCRGDAVALRPTTDIAARPKRASSASSSNQMPAAADMNNPAQAFCAMMMHMMQSQMQPQQRTDPDDPRIEITRPPPQHRVRGLHALATSDDAPKAIEDAPKDVVTPPRPGSAADSTPVTQKKSLTPQQQADRFLLSLQGGVPDDDDDDDDDADPAQPKKSKGKGKGKGKAKTKAAAKSNAKAKAKASVSKSKTLVFNPVVALEATRKQYLFRPGLTFAESGESSKVFSFANHGGKAGASKAANKWLQDFKKSHTCK